MERYKFDTEIKRHETKSIPELETLIRVQAARWAFPSIKDLLDEALRMCFNCGINNDAIIKALLQEASDDINFSDIVDFARKVQESGKTAREQVSSQSKIV